MKKKLLLIIFVWLASHNLAFSQIDLDSLFGKGKEILDKISEASELTDAEETEFGNKLADEYNQSIKLSNYELNKVEKIGNIVAKYVDRKAITYKFKVLEDAEINAFSMAGGNIWVTTGLLKFASNDDELAFVIAHEISHEDKKHNMKRIQLLYRAYEIGGEDAAQLASIAQKLFTTPFEKYQEYEADETGVYLMHKSGYNASGAVTFFTKLVSKENDEGEKDIGYLFRSHPYSADRKKKIQNYIKTL